MSTDINLLRKGLIRMGILIILLISSPIIITMGFKGIQKINETPEIYFAYGLVLLGFFCIVFTIYFAFKVFSILRKALFSKN